MHKIFRMHSVLDSYIAKYYNCYCNSHLLRNMFFWKSKNSFSSMFCRWLQLKINVSNYLDFTQSGPGRLFAETKYFSRKPGRTLNRRWQTSDRLLWLVYCVLVYQYHHNPVHGFQQLSDLHDVHVCPCCQSPNNPGTGGNPDYTGGSGHIDIVRSLVTGGRHSHYDPCPDSRQDYYNNSSSLQRKGAILHNDSDCEARRGGIKCTSRWSGEQSPDPWSWESCNNSDNR